MSLLPKYLLVKMKQILYQPKEVIGDQDQVFKELLKNTGKSVIPAAEPGVR